MSHKVNAMPTGLDYRVVLRFDQDEDETVATAELFIGDLIYEAHGRTGVELLDTDVAMQLATARALSNLAHQLVDDASRVVGRVAREVAAVSEEAEDVYAELDA